VNDPLDRRPVQVLARRIREECEHRSHKEERKRLEYILYRVNRHLYALQSTSWLGQISRSKKEVISVIRGARGRSIDWLSTSTLLFGFKDPAAVIAAQRP
jgi:hypothetical protein